MGDKFSVTEVTALRNEILQSGIDAMQAAELLQVFLMGHGYGVSPEDARDAAYRVEAAGCSLEVIQKELDRVALVM